MTPEVKISLSQITCGINCPEKSGHPKRVFHFKLLYFLSFSVLLRDTTFLSHMDAD